MYSIMQTVYIMNTLILYNIEIMLHLFPMVLDLWGFQVTTWSLNGNAEVGPVTLFVGRSQKIEYCDVSICLSKWVSDSFLPCTSIACNRLMSQTQDIPMTSTGHHCTTAFWTEIRQVTGGLCLVGPSERLLACLFNLVSQSQGVQDASTGSSPKMRKACWDDGIPGCFHTFSFSWTLRSFWWYWKTVSFAVA